MNKRPKPSETDEDLERQAEEFLQKNVQPAVKILNVNKRKSNEGGSITDKPENTTRPKSLYAQRQAKNKKSKEGLVDNTVIEEVLKKKEKIASCSSGRIIARDVPSLVSTNISSTFYKDTNVANPEPPLLKMDELDLTSSNLERGNKSLYRLMWEKEHPEQALSATPSSSTSVNQSPSEEYLKNLGEKSYILNKNGNIHSKDVDEIHHENVKKISMMSHEERIAQQQELLAQISPKNLEFLKNFRKKNAPSTSNKCEMEDNVKSIDVKMEMENDEKDGNLEVETGKDPKSKRSVTFNEDVDMKEIPSKDEIVKHELPIDPEEAKKWIHMDKVEMDKLKWMTNLPDIKPLKDGEGHTARFSFEGDLLPYDADVDVRQALHHHGEEPERAGYTLDELFVLSRSRVVQQRNIGIRSISNILRNAKEGLYDDCFEVPILQLMVDAGVVLILRFALDESTALIYQEALRGLYYLVVSEADERCLDLFDPLVPAGLQPGVSSKTNANEQSRSELQEEEKELKDIEVIKLDMIRALIRMDCHLRLRYILETVRPSPQCVIHALGIFTRMVRHSLSAAWSLLRLPRLFNVIIENFLPENLSPLLTGIPLDKMTDVYGVPLWQALRFFRICASRGRQLASVIVNEHNIMKLLPTFISIEPSDMKIPLQDSLLLSQEAYGLWSVLLRYGLTNAVDVFKSCGLIFIKQLMFYRDKVSVNLNEVENKYNYDVGAHMINVVLEIFNVSSTTLVLKNRMIQNKPTVIEDGKEMVIPPPNISWEELNDFHSLIEVCLMKWLTEASGSELSYSGYRLLGSCCSFFNTYLQKCKPQKCYNPTAFMNLTKNIHKRISAFVSTDIFTNIISRLSKHSLLLSKHIPGTIRDPENLGSIGCITFKGAIIPIIQESSPIPFLNSVFGLSLILIKSNPFLDMSCFVKLMECPELISYLTKVSKHKSLLSSQWAARIEVQMLVNICLLCANINIAEKKIFHSIALSLISDIHNGDEIYARNLLKEVISSSDFVTDINEVSNVVGSMGLNDWVPLNSPAIKQPTLSVIQLTNNLLESLSTVGSIISKNLISYKKYELSNTFHNNIHYLTQSIMIDDTDEHLVTDEYYSLYSLKRLISVKKQKLVAESRYETAFESDISSPEIILLAKSCLQLLFLQLRFRRDALFAKTCITGWIRHLGLIFIAANDLFLDSEINSYLQACLVELLRDEGFKQLNWGLQFKGLGSSYAWYKQLLEQFIGVSYGDLTFALFIILPLQQYCPTEYRKLFWGDMCDVLPIIRLTEQQIKIFVPVEQFLEPEELKKEFLDVYGQGFGMGVSPKRTPLLYKIACHHIMKLRNKK